MVDKFQPISETEKPWNAFPFGRGRAVDRVVASYDPCTWALASKEREKREKIGPVRWRCIGREWAKRRRRTRDGRKCATSFCGPRKFRPSKYPNHWPNVYLTTASFLLSDLPFVNRATLSRHELRFRFRILFIPIIFAASCARISPISTHLRIWFAAVRVIHASGVASLLASTTDFLRN